MKLLSKEMLLVSASLLFALGLHVLVFNQIPMQFDELLMFNFVKKFNYFEMISNVYLFEVQQPLTYIWTKFLSDNISTSSFILRLPSLFMTFLMAWPFYLLARINLDREDALKAICLLLIFHPVMLFSGSMRPNIGLIFFSIVSFYGLRRSIRSILIVGLVGLFFVHPIGSILSLVLAGLFLIQKKTLSKGMILSMVIGAMLIAGIGILRKNEMGHILTGEFGLITYASSLYRFSFLFSGWGFALLIFGLGIYDISKARWKKMQIEVDLFWVYALLLSFVAYALLLLFFDKVFARHFIYCLPGLSILSVQLINMSTANKIARNGLFILAMGLLFYKSIIKEDIYHRPYELDSLAMANKSVELSHGQVPIAVCGICFSFYLNKEQQICLGPHFDYEKIKNYPQVVYMELDYVTKSCGTQNFKDLYNVDETYSFIGGKVHKLSSKVKQ